MSGRYAPELDKFCERLSGKKRKRRKITAVEYLPTQPYGRYRIVLDCGIVFQMIQAPKGVEADDQVVIDRRVWKKYETAAVAFFSQGRLWKVEPVQFKDFEITKN